MNYYIGIDGGGTKTKCVCVNEELKTILEMEGSASNPLVIGFDNAAVTLINLIEKVSKEKNISFCLMGIAGCGRDEHQKRLRKSLIKIAKEKKISLPDFEIVSDIEIAHEGAFAGKEGIILIVGTGSILFAKSKNGKTFKIGGYGKIIGDEGSGYSIGKKGLQAAAKFFDGRVNKTILTKILKENFGINSRDELINSIYNDNFDIPKFAPYVIKAAEEKDKVSVSILKEELNELELHLKAAREFLSGKKIKLCITGGLITNNNYYSKLLKERIKQHFKEIKINNAKYPPEIGAVILAHKIHSLNQKEI